MSMAGVFIFVIFVFCPALVLIAVFCFEATFDVAEPFRCGNGVFNVGGVSRRISGGILS